MAVLTREKQEVARKRKSHFFVVTGGVLVAAAIGILVAPAFTPVGMNIRNSKISLMLCMDGPVIFYTKPGVHWMHYYQDPIGLHGISLRIGNLVYIFQLETVGPDNP